MGSSGDVKKKRAAFEQQIKSLSMELSDQQSTSGKKIHYLLINNCLSLYIGAQSFISTSLMVDLRQDINRVSSFSRCLNGSFH